MHDQTQVKTQEVVHPTIMVVDSEPRIRDLLSRWLSFDGFRCAVAENAHEARNCLRHNDIRIVAMGLDTPEDSSAQLLQHIRSEYPDAGVIVLTGSEINTSALQSLTQGAWGYLLKPVERDEFLLQVKNAVNRLHLLVENQTYTHHLETRIEEHIVALRRAQEDTIHRLLTASRYRDEETGAHIKCTGLYSQVLAEAMGWPADQVQNIRLAAPMHDVGKIGIPDSILQKPGKLTTRQYEIMKMHTEIGAQMLSAPNSPMLQMAEEIARCHHEHWDGSGYPSGLSGSNIPESARIVAIVDVFDALTHDRVYRPAMNRDEALQLLIDGRATQFEPVILDLFLDLLPDIEWIEEENPDDFSEVPFPGTQDEPTGTIVPLIETA